MALIKTLDVDWAARMLRLDEHGGWSYDGALAMANYLDDYSDDVGCDVEVDVVAIRCDYTEYDSALEAATEYGFVPHDDEGEDGALEWLRDQTTVIEVDGGHVIVEAF